MSRRCRVLYQKSALDLGRSVAVSCSHCCTDFNSEFNSDFENIKAVFGIRTQLIVNCCWNITVAARSCHCCALCQMKVVRSGLVALNFVYVNELHSDERLSQ